MFHPPVTSDVIGHERAYTEDVENPRQHSFSRSRSETSPAARLAVQPKDAKPRARDRQAILSLLKTYRLDNEAVDRLKKTEWEVRRPRALPPTLRLPRPRPGGPRADRAPPAETDPRADISSLLHPGNPAVRGVPRRHRPVVPVVRAAPVRAHLPLQVRAQLDAARRRHVPSLRVARARGARRVAARAASGRVAHGPRRGATGRRGRGARGGGGGAAAGAAGADAAGAAAARGCARERPQAARAELERWERARGRGRAEGEERRARAVGERGGGRVAACVGCTGRGGRGCGRRPRFFCFSCSVYCWLAGCGRRVC